MNVFITGATGFIGKRLLKFIEASNLFEKTYCLCRNESSLSQRFNVISGSLDDLPNITPINADVCIHLAAATNNSATNNSDIFETNAEGTAHVVEFCKRSNIPKIVFISSINVHLKKKYSYALSKLKAEEYIKNSNLKYSILRCSLVYGDGCTTFEKILKFAKLFHIVPVLGSGKAYEQPIHIDDVCKAIINHSTSSESNVVCDLYGKAKMRYNDMVKILLKENGIKAFLLHLPTHPVRVLSEFFYKNNIPFPIHPEQISHMCEDLCNEDESIDLNTNHLDEFRKNLHKKESQNEKIY